MQIPQNILILVEKYHAGTLTPAEKLELDEWYQSFEDREAVVYSATATQEHIHDTLKERILISIDKQSPALANHKKRNWLPAAAILLALAFTSAFLFWSKTKPSVHNPVAKTVVPKPQAKPDIAPGGNKAILTLADGSTIILDSAANGLLGKQGNIKVQKLENGLLAYAIDGRTIAENDAAFYNTISTPRGGQYQVTLADGSQVWLNAASSIRFPVAFTGKERKVEITGEAYFEVAKDAARPFKVSANGSEVEVLGTHFNINAYDDETAIRTTLLEGKVKVSVANAAATAKYLLPGQQSNISKEGTIKVVNDADTEEAVAWKNGRFQFKSADLKSILRQISRWYNVDIEYRGNVTLHFTGQLTRNANVSKVFEKLALTNEVHFTISGQKIIVSP
jgi:transmembrane sensor